MLTITFADEENAMSLDNNSYISFLRKQHELDKINLACSATLLVGIIQVITFTCFLAYWFLFNQRDSVVV